jgi:hypothetical protein
MAQLDYHPDTLHPLIALGDGEVTWLNRLRIYCTGNLREDGSGTEWFHNARFKDGLLEMAGLHAARASRAWGGVGFKKYANPDTKTVALPEQPEGKDYFDGSPPHVKVDPIVVVPETDVGPEAPIGYLIHPTINLGDLPPYPHINDGIEPVDDEEDDDE